MARRMITANGKIKCSTCGVSKKLSEYIPKSQKRGSGPCKPCWNEEKKARYHGDLERHRGYARQKRLRNPERSREINRKWFAAEPGRMREHNLRRNYGIGTLDYEKIFQKQKGKCFLCKVPHEETFKGLFVDHCHDSGKIRGLLCRKCNTGIGLLGDNAKSLRKVLKYLEREK